LLPEPVSFSGKPVLTIKLLKIGLKDAKQYIDPFISIYVKGESELTMVTLALPFPNFSKRLTIAFTLICVVLRQ